MDWERYARKQVDDAIEAGELEPTAGIGEPIHGLTHDPDWWIRAFLEREKMPDRRAEILEHRDGVIAEAVAAHDLDTARSLIAALNRVLRRWNDKAPEEFAIEPVSEIWLITERARAPGR